MTFDEPGLFDALERLSPEELDALPFGVIRMSSDAAVVHYNRTEAQLAGLAPERVLGLNFFSDVAPCTNNYLVSGRYDDEGILDETLPYVFTLRMKPSPVHLRLLKVPGAPHQYLVVQRP